jgi:hypothetical protein
MLKVKVMKNRDGFNIRSQRQICIRREKEVGPELFQNMRDAVFKPQVIKKRMARLGFGHDWGDVIREDKTFIPFPVEDKIKLMFGMGHGNPLQGFISHPSDAFQFIGKK